MCVLAEIIYKKYHSKISHLMLMILDILNVESNPNKDIDFNDCLKQDVVYHKIQHFLLIYNKVFIFMKHIISIYASYYIMLI